MDEENDGGIQWFQTVAEEEGYIEWLDAQDKTQEVVACLTRDDGTGFAPQANRTLN